MNESSYRRHRLFYTFRAWTGGDGSNRDRDHERYCVCHDPSMHTHYEGAHYCDHLRLWDVNTNRRSANILRVVYRRYPRALGVYVGPMMRLRFQFGLAR